jgi:hypothetical protein
VLQQAIYPPIALLFACFCEIPSLYCAATPVQGAHHLLSDAEGPDGDEAAAGGPIRNKGPISTVVPASAEKTATDEFSFVDEEEDAAWKYLMEATMHSKSTRSKKKAFGDVGGDGAVAGPPKGDESDDGLKTRHSRRRHNMSCYHSASKQSKSTTSNKRNIAAAKPSERAAIKKRKVSTERVEKVANKERYLPKTLLLSPGAAIRACSFYVLATMELKRSEVLHTGDLAKCAAITSASALAFRAAKLNSEIEIPFVVGSGIKAKLYITRLAQQVEGEPTEVPRIILRHRTVLESKRDLVEFVALVAAALTKITNLMETKEGKRALLDIDDMRAPTHPNNCLSAKQSEGDPSSEDDPQYSDTRMAMPWSVTVRSLRWLLATRILP